MRAGESEPGEFRVVEFCSQPAVKRVALLAVRGVTSGRVIRIAGPGELARVAGITRGGEAYELSAGRSLVARLAGERGVRPDQGKAVLVLLNVLDGNLPSFHGVARFTLGAHLAAMNIGMAVSAFLSNVSEYKFRVTLCATNLGMHPAQRVRRLVVIEVRYGPDRLPVDAGMAGLAGNAECAVGAPR